MSLEKYVNGILVNSIPTQNRDDTYSFQILEHCWDRDVTYIKNVSANCVSFEVCACGYKLYVLPGTFGLLEEQSIKAGNTIGGIYPVFNY